jgi:hypothetical protein
LTSRTDLAFHAVSSSVAAERAPLLCRTLNERETISWKLIWLSFLVTFLIANSPPGLIEAAILKLLQRDTTITLLSHLGVTRDAQNIAVNLTESIFVPLKELLFLICLIVIAYPIALCCSRSRDLWRAVGLKKVTAFALSLFVSLSILVFPYPYPNGLNSHASGLAGLGTSFGRMSLAPFQESDPLYFKRILKPAVAHFTHLHGYFAYYVFSLLLTFVFIFLVVAFLETSLVPEKATQSGHSAMNPVSRWIIYLSLMTSSFALVDFQWPGYSDHLSFILILVMAFVPMNRQARLAIIALCLLNHEGIALALVPVILFSFPRQERVHAFMVIGMFYGFMLISHGFSIAHWFRGQGAVRDTGSVWATVVQKPEIFLIGVFYAYKLLWLLLPVVLWMLWQRINKVALIGLGVVTIFPVALTFFAWDTTRVAAFGWLGLLTAVGLFLKEQSRLSNGYRYGVVSLGCINLLIPSYNVVIYYENTLSLYPYPGAYQFLDFIARHVWS